MKYIHKKSRNILRRLPSGEAPPREWFESQGIQGTYVGWFSWMHYYTDGIDYYIHRTDEVEVYNGEKSVGEVEPSEASVAA